MCIILVAHKLSTETPLLVLANRDEFYSRPTVAATEWQGSQGLIGGRDLVSDGTWFGARHQRWATVTNVREGGKGQTHHQKSRGWLVRDYLQGDLSAEDYLQTLQSEQDDFAGFNLLLGDADNLWYTSNRASDFKLLEPGLYGLSNHLLDTPWPKILRGKAGLAKIAAQGAVDKDAAFELLTDTTLAADADLPDTGVPLKWERALSALFIIMPKYGTRCSTLLIADHNNNYQFTERRYQGDPQLWEESVFSWRSA
jgi:uncharacterized protein with NRDE domain